MAGRFFSDNGKDFYFDISVGRYRDCSSVVKFGYAQNVSTNAVVTVWAASGRWVRLNSAEQLTLQSSHSLESVNGAINFLIQGLDKDFNEIQEVVFSNGTNPVTTDQSFLRAPRVFAISAGAYLTNTGNITIKASSSGSIQAYIPESKGQTQQLIFTTPKGYSLLVTDIYLSSVKNSGGQQPIVNFDAVVNGSGLAQRILFSSKIDTGIFPESNYHQTVMTELPEKSDLEITVISNQANTEVYSRIYGIQFKK